jgi:hypothetical protein
LDGTLPAVSIATVPVNGADQRYQRDAPLGIPACHGSPSSNDASRFEAVTEPLAPERVCAAANRSFAPTAAMRHVSRVTRVSRESPVRRIE